MTRVLFLIDKLSRGGTQQNLLEIVKGLDRTRFEPHVIALCEAGELAPEFRRAGAEPVQLHVKRAYDASAVRAFQYLVRYMKQLKIDIVQTHFLHADILGTLAALVARVPKIVTTRRDEGFWRSARQRLINRFFNLFCSQVLVNSEAVKMAVLEREGVAHKKLFVIRNGVDTRTFFASYELRDSARKELGFKEGERVIGLIANMRHSVKGHSTLIEALPAVLKKAPFVKLLLVGEGSLRGQLENLAENLGVREKIVFAGSRPDTNQMLNAMDIFCLPSLSEGFSNAILEAMAVGLPVVATKVGGNPEAVREGVTGFLVRPRSSSALEAKLLRLIEDHDLRRQFAEAGKKRILSEFRIVQMVEKYETFYSVIARPDRPKQSRGLGTGSAISEIASGTSCPRNDGAVKLLYLIWSLDLGGAEQIVTHLARKVDRTHFEPIVCCLNGKGRYAPLLEAEGIPVIALHKRPKLDLVLIPRLVRMIRKEKIGLIHTHLFGANFWGRIAAFLTGVPVVSSEHGMDAWRSGLHFGLDTLLTPINKQVIFVSEGVKNFYSRRNPKLNGKGRVLHNGIDISNFEKAPSPEGVRQSLGLKRTDTVIGIVGRLVPEKAHVDFIEAIQVLIQDGHDVKGLIVGEGELKEALESRVRQAQLEDKIIFAGYRSDLADLYSAMDVFVMCSLREGFPLTVLEAMAAGVPVVATGVGGIPECIEDGVDGLLVPPGDAVLLCEAISKILEGKDLRKSLIEKAREKVAQRFSVEKMVREHELLYEEVLAS